MHYLYTNYKHASKQNLYKFYNNQLDNIEVEEIIKLTNLIEKRTF